MHTPPQQSSSAKQGMSHSPQWALSKFVSTHVPSQQSSEQKTSQPPQLALSEFVSMHVLLQQLSVSWQKLPHVPQSELLEVVSTHPPLQHSQGQEISQPPQWLGSALV